MAARKGNPSTALLIAEALAIEAEDARQAGTLGYMARALVQATMPHRKTLGTEFMRRNGAYTLSMLSPSTVGLPYGTVPRLLLVWLCTEAVKTRRRDLMLGDNLSAFMRELNMVPTGGRWGSIGRLKEQTKRLFSATVSCVHEDARKRTTLLGYRVADQAVFWWDTQHPDQASLWNSTVRLTESFYNEVIAHPVPVDMRALKTLTRSPLAIDLYCWLTHRMSYLRRDTEIPWEGLATQFGSDYGRLRAFKAALLTELRKVQTVYPEARIGIGEAGLLLRPSRTHVVRK